jgi:cyclophilin family peptidyl-prolyl cis-trans isomerase
MRSKTIFIAVVAVLIFGASLWFAPKANQVPETERTETLEGVPGGDGQATTTPDTRATTTVPADTSVSNEQKPTMINATIATTKGDIQVELFVTDAPKAAENFASLAEKGFYDGVIFHRVIPGFMIQGGDPTGTGTGGPGYRFEDELDPNTESAKRGYTRGTLAMANAGPNTNGSQFFIMHADYPLPHNYTIFGRVTAGIEVVDAIASVPVVPVDRPAEEIKMNKVTVVRK